MPLPYQAILRLPAKTDAVALAEQEMERWLLLKADRERRELVRSGALFQPGVHEVARGKTLTVVHADRPEDGSRRRRIHLLDGDWEASLTAIDYPAGNRRQDALVITAGKAESSGDSDETWEADPPRFVKDLLARELIYDGAAHVTAEPHFIGPEDVDDVLDAIVDRSRSVSVIVAASLGTEYDAEFSTRVSRLTAKVIGVASIYFVSQPAIEAMNARLGSAHAVLGGRIRTFLPLVDLEDAADARRHRVLGPATFARAIRERDVASGLKSSFARETRSALLARSLPSDLRRGFEALDAALAQTQQDVRIRSRVRDRLSVDAPAEVLPHDTPVLPHGQTSDSAPPADAAAAPSRSDSVLVYRLESLVRRWLKTAEPVSEDNVESLELLLAEQAATAEVLRETVSTSDAKRREAEERATVFRNQRDELDLELAIADEDAAALRRQIGALQSRLREAGRYEDIIYEAPAAELVWETPQSLLELAEGLRADSSHQHPAFARVEFTGDLRDVEDVQSRDLVGRYAAAFWEFVHVLNDYAEARIEGRFDGNVHQYLRSDALGYKCSPQRHAAKESESVLSNSTWRRQRVLTVPADVDPSGAILMEAHFRPTHSDTFAPRMHYFDDVAGTGKIYIGYIGRHLENTKSKNA